MNLNDLCTISFKKRNVREIVINHSGIYCVDGLEKIWLQPDGTSFHVFDKFGDEIKPKWSNKISDYFRLK